MTTDQQALLALDLGTATASAALLGRIDGRWRLIGAASGPSALSLEPAIGDLVAGVAAADPALAASLGLPARPGAAGDPGILPRLTARSAPTPRLAVLAATPRHLARLAPVADASGWRTHPVTADGTDRIALARLLLDPNLRAVVVGAGDPIAADERRPLADLVRAVAGIASRRPEMRVLLAGGAAVHAQAFGTSDVAVLPAATAGEPQGEDLRLALRRLRPVPEDAREAIARSAASLAEVLDRRVETIEIGADAGLRVVSSATGDGTGSSASAVVAAAALVPPDPDDGVLRGVIDWSTVPRDRHRLRDRLRDLRRDPWSDAAGDGALLRISAARAAVGRLLRATPHLDGPAPDLVVASGGAWAVAPGPAVTLALADVVRRPGVSQYAVDAARLLGPLGMVGDESDRRMMLADLAEDLLVPLGSVVVVGDVHRSRHPGNVVVEAEGARTELELVSGGLQLVDLPPGEIARARLRFHDPVVLGGRGRGFDVEVSGGLGGLLIDLRDVPLHLPDRAERRRELLASWQAALWSGLEP